MVYLIGAGPGDPGLITVKALDLLKRADVVLYDRLINTSLLSHTRPDCTLIDVGKGEGKHTKTQDETTEMLVELGRKKLEVVRLKGGDPFLFGRGAEEAGRLKEEGIPYEIVPGVSALNAATAYAGIPLTHRDHASSVGIATGHGAQGKKEDPVRWRTLARSVDTIVVFMGVGNMGSIIDELKEGGLSAETPAALIEQGTTPSQKVVTGTLATIQERAQKHNVSPPALCIVGKTVSLHDKLKWYQSGPLCGIRIGVTRPYKQSKLFSEKLSMLGAEPVLMPTITIVETINTPQVKRAMRKLDSYHFILFFSVNGVESFFRALKNENREVHSLGGKVIAAIGPATTDALEKRGVSVDVQAETFIAEGLLDALFSHTDVVAKRFLLVRSDIGRNTVPESLQAAGATVDDISFYSTQPESLEQSMIDRLRKGDIDIVTFTSSSTVDGFFKSVKTSEIPDTVRFASIGPQTSKTIRKHGMIPAITASAYSTDGVIQAILEAYKKG